MTRTLINSSVRRLVLASINDAYTPDQLRDPRINALIARPLVDRLYNPDDISLVYCLLANRVQFLREQSNTVHQTVNATRATLCELVASRVLRHFHEETPGRPGLLLLANILVAGFDPFQGAPKNVEREGRHLQWPVQNRGGYERKLTALELAIISESKTFISSSACQRVVTDVYEGRVVYTALSFVDILPDHYKHRPVSLYDPHKAPLLNHYRLIVPRSRSAIELLHFTILLLLYALTMIHRKSANLHIYEVPFSFFTAGWVLDEFAAIIEHGWEVHSQNLWSFLDITFTSIYVVYVVARVYDLSTGQLNNEFGLHMLCTAAPVLLTRIAFNLMPDNIAFISLHAMMKDFALLTFLAVWCFTGFLLALRWLIDTNTANDEAPSWATVSKWLLWIWFGLDGTGIEESAEFHVVLGPALMIAFAFLGNTLFLTILVAVLTNTFSKIIADDIAEIQFRRAVPTFEGVKSDSIFAYPPPFNILALATLLPLKFLLSPANVPHSQCGDDSGVKRPYSFTDQPVRATPPLGAFEVKPKQVIPKLEFHRFLSPRGYSEAVFKATPPPNVRKAIEELDVLGEEDVLENAIISRPSQERSGSEVQRRRLSSSSGVFPLTSVRAI